MSLDKTILNHHTSFHLSNQLSVDALNIVTDKLNISKYAAYIFMSDEELLQLNKSLLKHDYYTDIITLDYTDDEDYSHNEIYISVDRVVENAKTFQTSAIDELTRVCIHGLLHISGQGDKTEAEKKKMSALEDEYLVLYRST